MYNTVKNEDEEEDYDRDEYKAIIKKNIYVK